MKDDVMPSKEYLIESLKRERCFWSFAVDTVSDVPDDIIIEKTLIYLDLPEIKTLFDIYPARRIKRVWLDSLVPQGEYMHTLNRFFAWYLFGIKRPDSYLKAMETRNLNRLCS